jgi:hypothetical protein
VCAVDRKITGRRAGEGSPLFQNMYDYGETMSKKQTAIVALLGAFCLHLSIDAEGASQIILGLMAGSYIFAAFTI